MKDADNMPEIKTDHQWGHRPFESLGLREAKERRTCHLRLLLWKAAMLIVLVAGVWYELHTSALQSWLLARYAVKLSYTVEPGASQNVVFPTDGPFNKRRGYSQIPEFQRRLTQRNYQVTEQASFSPELMKIAKRGVTPPYRENPVAGLVIRDADGSPVYDAVARHRQVFQVFEDIPPLIVQALLFIEDRELDNPVVPYSNPVINWNRLAMAGILYGGNKLGLPLRVEGGSTLATQLEKYRYSPHGNTSSVFEKLRQMTSASLRVYKDGVDTRAARRQIILDYINTAPLAAVPRHGEIYGLGEGFYGWFGQNLRDVSRALFSPEPDVAKARTFKQALTLLCAVRAPTYYMAQNYPALEKRVSDYVTLMEKEGVIAPEFAELVHPARITFSPGHFQSASVSGAMHKAVNLIRNKLMRMLGVSGYYDLDRLDVEADVTINTDLQKNVAVLFENLKEDAFLEENGLKTHRLLASGDVQKMIYSFLLFERTPEGNMLRVHADNLDQPFDINQGMKLILGSTAKLRTLAHYLEIVAGLHTEFSGMDEPSLKKQAARFRDPLTRWVVARLRQDRSLSPEGLLEKALERSYSANPDEAFFTGGGIHTFENFRSEHDHQIISVKDATIHSINLVYVRLMRDIVDFHKARLPYDAQAVLKDSDHPERRHLLEEIADNEATQHLRGFYRNYRDLLPEAALRHLLKRRSDSLRNLAILFFAWHPGADEEKLLQWLKARGKDVSQMKAWRLFRSYGKAHLTLSDYGFLLKKHPLEVWCVGEMTRHPGISWKELLAKSGEVRRLSSAWLLQKKMRKPQNIRLRTRIEQDAFKEITAIWRRLGFPFRHLVPSYSTALGSSADQPAALAKLFGIILNNGMDRSPVSIRKLRIADGTPYHTVFQLPEQPGKRAMAAPVARALRTVLQNVVEQGTARRAKGVFAAPDGTPVVAGGKTGTGDNRFKTFDNSGNLLSSRAVNRTATFAFYIGDQYFGVVTAFVSGPESGEYRFTSSLPVSILKLLAPAINAYLSPRDLKLAQIPEPMS
ncbi:MAG: hypothetical protein B6245_21495 [Desulfobacteraceae bacterium 4572_88]|nr:MAG: hypothetical protein B6245_21495 [Desulfobacteraceae bacterium 4572_88]